MITYKTLVIAKREFITAIKQKMFLIVTFGIPLLFIFIVGLSVLHSFFLANEITENISSVGIVDKAEIIDDKNINDLINPDLLGLNVAENDKSTLKPIVKKFLENIKIYEYDSHSEGMEDLQNNKIHVLYIIPKNYLEEGEVRSYSKKAKIFTGGDYFLRWALRSTLLEGKVEPLIQNRIQDPVTLNHFILTSSGEVTKEDDLKFWGTLLVPYIASGIMMLTIFVPSSYLLQSVAEEKESRIIEILLSSVSSEELLTGKMMGLGAAGLIQACVWLIFIAIPLSIGTVYFKIGVVNILLYFMYIILGFLLYGSIMAGIGSLGYDSKQSAQMAGVCSTVSVLPLLFLPILVLYPNGLIAKIMSYIPFTSSVTMMVRLSSDKVDIIDILITVLILVPTIIFVVKISAKIFRANILMYGKRFSVREIVRWLKSAN
ncbi:MAG: ABC transporter permease [Cyanobacteriota bacterium]